VDFSVVQAIAAPCDAVIAALADPAFYPRLGELPSIKAPEVLECHDDGNVVRLRVQYHFAGNLAPAARKVLDPQRLSWVDESVLDRSLRRLEFTIRPDHYADRLKCRGVSMFESDGDAATTQRVAGVMQVNFPLVGRAVERAIVSGLTDHLAHEAAVLAQ
jgi:hypothetical protein